MSRFEYLSVLISIVIGLGLSEVVTNWGRILRRRRRVGFYWLHGLWSVFTVVFMVQFWWGFWNFRTVDAWTFAGLGAVVSEALVMVLAALVLVPDEVPSAGLDLRHHYYEHSRLFFCLAAALLVQLAVVDSVVSDQRFLHVENAIRGAGLVVVAVAAFSESERVHAAVGVAGVTLFAWFTASAAYW